MHIFKEIKPLRDYLAGIRKAPGRLGLVPTMGALHAGHISLVKACQWENDHTLCTIFVNPIQFNNQVDLENYPVSLDEDLSLLKRINCEALFCPSAFEMYPSDPHISFGFNHLDETLEGQSRPGHFSGVALVVSKLFHITEPDAAYFGQKDYQQYCVIRQLSQDLNFPVELRCMPIVREPDGLAMSSRNRRLSPEEREKAPIFYQLLSEAKRAIREGTPWSEVKSDVKASIERVPGASLEYFEAADARSLRVLDAIHDSGNVLLLTAGYVGRVRLIDNLFLAD